MPLQFIVIWLLLSKDAIAYTYDDQVLKQQMRHMLKIEFVYCVNVRERIYIIQVVIANNKWFEWGHKERAHSILDSFPIRSSNSFYKNIEFVGNRATSEEEEEEGEKEEGNAEQHRK